MKFTVFIPVFNLENMSHGGIIKKGAELPFDSPSQGMILGFDGLPNVSIAECGYDEDYNPPAFIETNAAVFEKTEELIELKRLGWSVECGDPIDWKEFTIVERTESYM